MSLRTKILSGFLILALMLCVAAVWSIYELRSIGSSVQDLLDDNYKSIRAGETMIEALEREDSGVLLLLLGLWKEGRPIIESADKAFQKAFKIAEGNITIPGEKAIVDEIMIKYNAYKGLWVKPIAGTQHEGDLDWYLYNIHKAFEEVKASLEKLMTINHQTMYDTASDLKNRAHRAVMPGIVAILSALIFTLIFNYFISYYMVSPIIKLVEGIGKFLKNGIPFDVQIETNDELQNLTDSIRGLISRVKTDAAKE